MPTCFIHAGLSKTGTSSFQLFVQQNRDWLHAQGLYVPQTGQHVRNGGHHRLTTWPVPAALAEELVEAGTPDALISSELFGVSLLKPRNIKTYHRYFSDLGYSICIIVYFRNFPQHFNSGYAQTAKMFQQTMSFEEDTQRRMEAIKARWPAFMRLAQRRSIKFVPKRYDAATRRQGIVNSLLAEIGLPPWQEKTHRANIATGPFFVHLARHLKVAAAPVAQKLTPEQRLACHQAVQQALAGGPEEPASFCGLTTESARAIEAHMKDANDEAARLFWGKSWADSFPDEVGRAFQPNDIDLVGFANGQEARFRQLKEDTLPKIMEIAGDPDWGERSGSSAGGLVTAVRPHWLVATSIAAPAARRTARPCAAFGSAARPQTKAAQASWSQKKPIIGKSRQKPAVFPAVRLDGR